MSFRTEELITSFDNVIKEIGVPIAINTFTSSFSGADYDDEYITLAGSHYGSGTFFPVTLKDSYGGMEKKYLEEGKIKIDDLKLYTPNSLTITSNSKVSIAGSIYKVLPMGILNYSVAGSGVYNKSYIRILNTGSFWGMI